MPDGDQAQQDLKETGRIEAFSDGVFAVAITLLVLDLKVPTLDGPGGVGTPGGPHLWDALVQQWPAYFAFLTSFAFVGIMWINHHRLFELIKRADNKLLIYNLLLLLGVTIVPFTTGVVAAYLRVPAEVPTAAMVLNGGSFAVAILFNLLWRYASGGNRLLDRRVDPVAVQAISRQYVGGPLLYGVAFILAWFNLVPASLALNFGLALFFARPGRPLPLIAPRS